MKSRSKVFVFLAYLALGIAISLPLQVMIMFRHYPWEIASILSKLTEVNLAVMGLAVLYSYLLLQVSPWVKYFSAAFVLLVAFNNFLVAYYQMNYNPLLSAIATLAVLFMHAPLLMNDARNVLNHPELRWWRTAFRKSIALPAFIRSVNGRQIYSRTHNISLTGAFICTDAQTQLSVHKPRIITKGEQALRRLQTETGIPSDLTEKNNPAQPEWKVGSRCSLQLTLGEGQALEVQGEVVRKSESFGRSPAGIAIKFHWLDRISRQKLEKFLNQPARIPASASMTATI